MSRALLLVFAMLLAVGAAAQNNAPADSASPAVLVEAAWHAVRDAYWDAAFNGVDWPGVRDAFLSREYASAQEAHAAIEAMLARLDDPAVRFLEAGDLAALLGDLSARGGPGLGLMELLSVDVDERTHRLTVVTPVPGTPAARAGLRPHDVLAAIDGTATDGLPLHEATALLRGAAGTQVTLTIQRGEEHFDATLTREALPPRTNVVHSALREEGGLRVGYLGLEQFTEGSAQQVREAVAALARRGAGGFVLDLRNNPGGLLPEATAVAGLFLPPRVPLAVLQTRGDTLQTLRTTEAALTNAPLAVLVNEGTASAAEVLAGALQAHGRAAVVGTRTFGKGLAHTVQPLPDGSAVMLPMARLVTPTGRDLLDDGLAPDVTLETLVSPVLDEALKAASRDDVQYARAVEEIVRQDGLY